MAKIRFKRGTQAQLATAATANELLSGEPYLIDDNSLGIGTGTGTYVKLGTGIFFINHGADAEVARPAGCTFGIWYGSVQPTTMVAPDIVIRTDEAV
jgi:hypothetical protein